jgi:hypothetical protein
VAVAGDVPNKFDLVVNGEGYVFYDPWTGGDSSNAPQKAIFTQTPTFIPRQNAQGDFGDNQQDFWLTFSQKDWSLGEQQKYAVKESEGVRRYWRGSSADVLTPGQVSIRSLVDYLAFAAPPTAMAYRSASSVISFASSTNLYTIDSSETITDQGAHGLGASPSYRGIASDGTNVFLTTETAGTVGVRRWSGSAFSTFSATASSALEYLNNSLYGLDKDGILRRYDTAGVASTLYTWQLANGTAMTFDTKSYIRAFGGKLLILFRQNGSPSPEMWIYDGSGTSILHRFSANFVPVGMSVLEGIVFISGYLKQSTTKYRPVIYYYANGSLGVLWQANDYSTTGSSGPDVISFDGNLVFNDAQTGRIMMYNPASGGVSSLGSYTSSGSDDQLLVAADSFFVLSHASAAGYQTPALVQSNGSNGGGTQPNIVWGSPTTAGNLLLLTLTARDTGGAPTFTTPSGWTLIDSQTVGTMRTGMYYIAASASRSGQEFITTTPNNPTEWETQAFEYSGAQLLDKSAKSSGTSVTADSGTTAATTQTDELFFAVLAHQGTDAQTSPTNSYVSPRNELGGANRQYAYAKNVTATQTTSVSATIASANWMGIVATFKAKATGGGYFFPGTTKATGADVTWSLIDFDSSLTKLFRGIKTEFDAATDGNGGTVDIAYRVGDVDGAYTTLQTGVTSGTEYTLSGVSGRQISLKVTLNKGTSTNGPVLKREYLRAVPVQPNFRRHQYVVDCTGGPDSQIRDRTGQAFPKTGLAMLTNLRSAATSSTPITIVDALGSYTGIIEQFEAYSIRPAARQSYVARIICREI